MQKSSPSHCHSNSPRRGPSYLLKLPAPEVSALQKPGCFYSRVTGRGSAFSVLSLNPDSRPYVRSQGAQSPYLKCIQVRAPVQLQHVKRLAISQSTSPLQIVHPPGCSDTSSRKVTGIFPEHSEGLRGCDSNPRFAFQFGHQVQSGNLGRVQEDRGPPPYPLLQEPGAHPPPHPQLPDRLPPPPAAAPHSPRQPAAPRRSRKCVTRPRASLSRKSAAPSWWCSGPRPCNPSLSYRDFCPPRPSLASPGRRDIISRGGMGKHQRGALDSPPGVAPGICIFVKLHVQPNLGVNGLGLWI